MDMTSVFSFGGSNGFGGFVEREKNYFMVVQIEFG
jgi:hypothetical protein